MNKDKPVSSLEVTAYTFLGAVAWTVHFMLLYAFAEFGCVVGFKLTSFGIIALTFILLAVGCFSFFKSYMINKSTSSKISSTIFFLSGFGILCNAVFTFIIAFQSVPVFYFKGECL